MVNRFQEENFQLPGDVYEPPVEEEEKSVDVVVADTLAEIQFQEQNIMPEAPMGPPPPPDFGPALPPPVQSTTPQPAPPQPDPLVEFQSFLEQNTNLPNTDPMLPMQIDPVAGVTGPGTIDTLVGPSGITSTYTTPEEYYDASLGRFDQQVQNTLKPLEEEALRLNQVIDDFNDTGILPTEFASVDDLNAKALAAFNAYQGAVDAHVTNRESESERLFNMLTDMSVQTNLLGEGNAYTGFFRDPSTGRVPGYVTSNGLAQQMTAPVTGKELDAMNARLTEAYFGRIQQEAEMVRDNRDNQFLLSNILLGGQGQDVATLVSYNDRQHRAGISEDAYDLAVQTQMGNLNANSTHNNDVERRIRIYLESVGGQPRTRDEMRRLREMEGEFWIEGRPISEYDASDPRISQYVDSKGVPRIGVSNANPAGMAPPSSFGSDALQTYNLFGGLPVVGNVLDIGQSYISGLAEDMKFAWGVLPKPAQKAVMTAIEFPEAIAKNIISNTYAFSREEVIAIYNRDPKRLGRAFLTMGKDQQGTGMLLLPDIAMRQAIDIAEGEDVEPRELADKLFLTPVQRRHDENVLIYEEEVPSKIRTPAEFALSVAIDPLNFVAPVKWAGKAGDALALRTQRNTLMPLVGDAFRGATESDRRFIDGVSYAVNGNFKMTDVAKEQYIQDLVLGSTGVKLDGDSLLMDEFTQRVSYRMLVEEPTDFPLIIREEWGRVRTKNDSLSTVMGTDEEIANLSRDVERTLRASNVEFLDQAGVRNGIDAKFDSAADAAWRSQREDATRLFNIGTPVTDGPATIEDLVAWGASPQDVFDGTWYRTILSEAEQGSPVAFPSELAQERVSEATYAFLDTQHEMLRRTNKGYKAPPRPRDHQEAMRQIRRLAGDEVADMPPGRTGDHVLQDQNYQRYFIEQENEAVTWRQLQLLDAKSRSSGVNLFEPLAQASNYPAFSRARMDQILQHLPISSPQKHELYRISGLADGNADSLSLIGFNKTVKNDDQGMRLMKSHIDSMSFDEAYETIGRHLGTINTVDSHFIYSAGDWIDNPSAFRKIPQEMQIKHQTSVIFDDLLVRRGKPDRAFSQWHSQRLTPQIFAKAAKDAVNDIKNGVFGAMINNDPTYGPILRRIAQLADMNDPRVVREIEDLMVLFSEMPKITSTNSNATAFKWLMDITQDSTIRRRILKGEYQFRPTRHVKNIANEQDARNVARDISTRRAVHTSMKNQLDRYEGFFETFVRTEDFATLREALTQVEITDTLRGSIRQVQSRLGMGTQEFRGTAREFLGMQRFDLDEIASGYKEARDTAGRLESEIRELETALINAGDTIPEAKMFAVSMGSYQPADDIAAFAREFKGQMPYTGPTGAFQQYFNRMTPELYFKQMKGELGQSYTQAIQTLRDDSTAEITFAKMIQNQKDGGFTSEVPAIRTLATTGKGIMTEAEEGIRLRALPHIKEKAAQKILDGHFASLDHMRRVGGKMVRTVHVGDDAMHFGSALDEAVWRSRLAPADAQLAPEKIAALTEDAGLTNEIANSWANQMDESIQSFQRQMPGEAMFIVDGRVRLDQPAVAKLLTKVKQAPKNAVNRIVDDIRNMDFTLTSGSSGLSEWSKIEGVDWHRRVRPRYQRREVDVHSPFSSAAREVNWQQHGSMIDDAIENSYTKDPIWNSPDASKVDKLADTSKMVRMGDDAYAFFDHFIELADANGVGRGYSTYDRIRWIGDGLTSGDPAMTEFYGDILQNSAEGRRLHDWMRFKDADGITNWEKVKADWHSLTPHFTAQRMPDVIFDQVGSFENGTRVFTDLGKLDRILKKGFKSLDTQGMSDLEKEEVATWLYGMRAIWDRGGSYRDSEGNLVTGLFRDQLKNKGGGWKEIVHADDVDAAILPKDAAEPIDKAGFLNNLANKVAEVEAARLGLDIGDIPKMMKFMYAVKGNLGYFWLGIPPRYLVNNIFGNIIGQIFSPARTDTYGGFGMVPRKVMNYWDDGGHVPRWIQGGMTGQSQFSEELAQRGIQPKFNVDLVAPTRVTESGRIVTDQPARATPYKLFFRNAQQARFSEGLRSGNVPLIPKAMQKFPLTRPVTWWADSMAWANESMELFSRRNIYGQEMFHSFKADFGERVADIALPPQVKQSIRDELDPAKIANMLSDANIDPRMRAFVMKEHAKAKTVADMRAYDQGRKAMRDYRMRNTWDTQLDKFFPYQFWLQKNLLFTGSSIAQRPALAAHAYRAFDLVGDGAESMPDSYKERLRLFKVPSQVPGVGGSEVWLKLNNIANPALVSMAMTVREFRDAQRSMDENSTVKQRILEQALTGGKIFYENMGMQAGPQFTTPLAVMNERGLQDWLDNDWLMGDFYDDVFGGANFVANPNGYRPELLPLGGLEDLAISGVDKSLSIAGVDNENIRARRLYEWSNQKVYGSPLSRFELMMARYVLTDMASEGFFGEVDMDGDVQTMSPEAYDSMMTTMIKLVEGDFDDPLVRDVLNRNYKGQNWFGGASVLGLNSAFVSEDLKNSFEIRNEYIRLRDEYGRDAARAYLLGEKNDNGDYVGGQGLSYVLDSFVYDEADELQSLLIQWRSGEAYPKTGTYESFVSADGEQITAPEGFSRRGLNAGGNIKHPSYLNSLAMRAESNDLRTAASPYFDQMNQIDEMYDTKVQKEMGKDNPNMKLVELYWKEGKRAKSRIYNRAEADGVDLSLEKRFPRGSSKWWNPQVTDLAFFEQNDVPLVEDDFGNMIYSSISRDRQADTAQRQTWYLMDLVTTQLGIEMFDMEGNYNPEYLNADGFFDQEAYDEAVAEAIELAPSMYHRLALEFSDITYGTTLYLADLSITPDQYEEYLRKDTIPELEQHMRDKSASHKDLAALSGPYEGMEYQDARRIHEDKYGLIINEPTDRPLVRNMATQIGQMFQDMDSSEQQKRFMNEYDHLFDETGSFLLENLTADDVITIGQDYDMDFPDSRIELGDLSQGAYMIGHYWYNVLEPNKKADWISHYANEDHEDFIPGLFEKVTRRDPETGEDYDFYRINTDVLSPEQVRFLLEAEDFPEFGDEGNVPRTGRELTDQALESRLVDDTMYERDMRFKLGQFYSGEAYLEDQDQLDNFHSWQIFVDENREMYDAAMDRMAAIREARPGDFISWEFVAANAADPDLSTWILDSYLPVYEELGVKDINQSAREWIDHTKDGQNLREYFPDNNFLEGKSDLGKDSPRVREIKTDFDTGASWIETSEDAENWSIWLAYKESHADLEKQAMELKIESELSWSDLAKIEGMDPALLEYITGRNEIYKDNNIFDLETKAALWLTSEEGQAVYYADENYFANKLWPLKYADDLSNPANNRPGGSQSTKGGGGSKTSGGSNRSGGTSTYASKSPGFNYSSDRTYGYQRTKIDDFKGDARSVFFLDEPMVSGQVADSEDRMAIAIQVADLIQSRMESYPALGLGREWIETLSGLWLAMAKRVLGTEPTLEDWMRLLNMFEGTTPGMPTVAVPSAEQVEQIQAEEQQQPVIDHNDRMLEMLLGGS